MIDFNDSNTAERRSNAKPLTFSEEERVILVLNRQEIRNSYDEALLQRFVDNYQNLCHYKSRTSK